jgi:hypothetical protein
LASGPLVFIGLISYSLYLWHWPTLVFCRYLSNEGLQGWTCAFAFAASFVAAYLSWKYVETPFRSGTAWSQERRVFSTALGTSLAITAVAAIAWGTHGLPQRYSKEVRALAETEGLQAIQQFETPEINRIVEDRLPVLGDAGAQPSFLVWGDSHAMAIGELVDQIARKHGVSGYLAARGGTLPVLEIWRPSKDQFQLHWNRAVAEFVKKKRIRHVILVARWSINIDGMPDGQMSPLIVDERSGVISPHESKRALKDGMERTIVELRRSAATVWLMKQVPEQPYCPWRALALAEIMPWRSTPEGVSISDHRRLHANIDEIFSHCKADDVHLCDPADDCFDKFGNSRISGENQCYYLDGDHLSRLGTEALWSQVLERCFSEIADDVRRARHGDGRS